MTQAKIKSRIYRGKDGGADGDRTHDLLTASQALSQLSYSPTEDYPYYKKIGFQSRYPLLQPERHPNHRKMTKRWQKSGKSLTFITIPIYFLKVLFSITKKNDKIFLEKGIKHACSKKTKQIL